MPHACPHLWDFLSYIMLLSLLRCMFSDYAWERFQLLVNWMQWFTLDLWACCCGSIEGGGGAAFNSQALNNWWSPLRTALKILSHGEGSDEFRPQAPYRCSCSSRKKYTSGNLAYGLWSSICFLMCSFELNYMFQDIWIEFYLILSP
jgi:hypothetical protein